MKEELAWAHSLSPNHRTVTSPQNHPTQNNPREPQHPEGGMGPEAGGAWPGRDGRGGQRCPCQRRACSGGRSDMPAPSGPGWVSLLGLGRDKAWRNAGPNAGPPGLRRCPWLRVRAPQQACSRCGHVYGWRPCNGGRAHVFCESRGSPLSWALACRQRLAGDQGAVGGNAGWDRGRPRPQGSRPARPAEPRGG